MTELIDLFIQRPFGSRTRRLDAYGDYCVKRGGTIIGNATFWARGWCFIGLGVYKAVPTQFYPSPYALREALRSGEVPLPPIEEARLSFSPGAGRQENSINVSYLGRKLGRIKNEYSGWRYYCFKLRDHGKLYPTPEALKEFLQESRIWET